MRNAWVGLASDLYDFYDERQDECFEKEKWCRLWGHKQRLVFYK
ncbi:hypothetical protein [Bernardetia sp. MNP-M8]